MFIFCLLKKKTHCLLLIFVLTRVLCEHNDGLHVIASLDVEEPFARSNNCNLYRTAPPIIITRARCIEIVHLIGGTFTFEYTLDNMFSP